jgi:uroporphyrinogen-III synthase
MLEIHFNLNESFHLNFRDVLRDKLKNLTIKIEYTDVYNTKFKPYIKCLDLYERTNNC